jgi:hypothetical protein
MPMKHFWEIKNDSLHVEYKWKKKNWHTLQVIADKNMEAIAVGSEEEFITEHYWGYTRMSQMKTSEYRVEHPQWQVYKTRDYNIDVDFSQIYGNEFSFLKYEKPKSVILAEGSEIIVQAASMIQS